MRAEHLKIWLAEAQAEENPTPSRWNILVDMVQLAFDMGSWRQSERGIPLPFFPRVVASTAV